MKSNKLIKSVAVALCGAITVGFVGGALAGCSKISNEETPLTIASDALDSVFNPYFYTSGPDGEVVGQTQVGLLSSDDNGLPVAGMTEPCVAEDFSVITTGTPDDMTSGDDYENYYTDYTFVLKNGLVFSDGTPLTYKDVLFNMYMYLDPAYTGSSTMYSVAIQGLKAYRTQSDDKAEQEGFESTFETAAEARINAIYDWADDKNSDWANVPAGVKADVIKAAALFKDEIATDWNTAQTVNLKEMYENSFTEINEPWEHFLYGYGLITGKVEKDLNGNKKYSIEYNGTDKIDRPSDPEKLKTTMTDYVYNMKIGNLDSANNMTVKDNISAIITYYATASEFYSYLISDEKEKYFENIGGLRIHTVSGITHETGKTYEKLENGVKVTKTLAEDHDIIKVRIDGVDPKAIQNFSFSVAPMHHYAGAERAAKFDDKTKDKEYFGVDFSNNDFMTSVRTNQVPLGAGPYRASTRNGIEETKLPVKGDFFEDNIVYLERNEHFMLGVPKIKKLCFKVVSQSLLYEEVKNGGVHFATPSMSKNNIGDLEKDKQIIGKQFSDTLGYGYIGINANFVHDINVRRAIMTTFNTQLCLDYYGGGTFASVITRPMSKTLTQYYPNADPYYDYDASGEAARAWLGDDYEFGNDGVLQHRTTGEKLKFTFTIAGDSDDHPAYQTMVNSAEILNRIGFEITVTKDSTALSKLASGTLAVWAAAWSSSSDPDMYQVYHKDSSATSIRAWGYPYLLRANGGTNEEKDIIEELAEYIDRGRQTTVVEDRKNIYSHALDLVMELAVEFPTYQRSTTYVYRRDIIDESTLTDTRGSAFRSPLQEIWNVSLLED